MHWRSRLAVVLGLLAITAASTPAEARRHHHHAYRHAHHSAKRLAAVHPHRHAARPRQAVGRQVASLDPSFTVGEAVARPFRFIAGQLTCARNVGAALAERGIKGTGSALAKSYLHWGRPSGPVPGAVAVYDRGGIYGHVAIVAKVEGSRVLLWNPGRRGWSLIAYHKRPIAYRVPA